jgi:hypothetical protein
VVCPWLDGRHVVFGEVKDGLDVVKKMEAQGSDSGRPKVRLTPALSPVTRIRLPLFLTKRLNAPAGAGDHRRLRAALKDARIDSRR